MPAFTFRRRSTNPQSPNDISLNQLQIDEVEGTSYTLKLKGIDDDDLITQDDKKNKKKKKEKRAPLPLLNEDIIYLILEHVYLDNNLRPEYKHFTKYALVHSAWRVPAQTLLFHEISVKDEKAFKCLDRLFSSQTKPSRKSTADGTLVLDLPHKERLRNSVRVLNFWIYKLRGFADLTNHWEARFPIVMCWFPYLYELRLGVDMLVKLQDKTINMLNTAKHSPSIRALQIAMRSDEYGNKPTTSTLPFQLITAVTRWKLEYLVMRGEPFQLGAHTDFPAVPHELVEFRWAVANSDTRVELDGLITYVTANSTKALEALTIPSPAHPIVGKVNTTLKSLKTGTTVGLPRNLHGLKELIIHPANEALPLDNTYYTNLPKQLSHFGFVCNYLPAVDSIKTARSNLAWKIKTFTIYSLNASQTYSYSSYSYSSNAASQANTVKTYVDGLNKDGTGAFVRVFAGPEEIQVGLRSDLIRPSPSQGYPRGVTVENMRLRRVAGMYDEEKEKRSGGKILKVVGSTFFKKQAPAADADADAEPAAPAEAKATSSSP